MINDRRAYPMHFCLLQKKKVGSRVPVLFSMLRFRRALLFNYRCSFLYIYVQQNLWFEPVNCFKAIFCFGHRVSQARFGSFFSVTSLLFFYFINSLKGKLRFCTKQVKNILPFFVWYAIWWRKDTFCFKDAQSIAYGDFQQCSDKN